MALRPQTQTVAALVCAYRPVSCTQGTEHARQYSHEPVIQTEHCEVATSRNKTQMNRNKNQKEERAQSKQRWPMQGLIATAQSSLLLDHMMNLLLSNCLAWADHQNHSSAQQQRARRMHKMHATQQIGRRHAQQADAEGAQSPR